MKKLRLFPIVLILLLLFSTVSVSAAPLLPYSIQVNRAWNTVTIYTYDAGGQYTVPVKAMICSTARAGYVTPLGSFRLTSFRKPWQLMLDGTYGQYSTQFSGNYLFHSICYQDDRHDAMVRDAYNNLGNPASMGCVRLETADAKWIFDNCPAGTPVTIYENYDSPGPLGKPEKTVDYISPEMYNGWDPTDPAENNPWRTAEITDIALSSYELHLQAGEAEKLQADYQPETAYLNWTSSNESVAKVDRSGNVIALSAGEAVITAAGYRGLSAQCFVTVENELLPFDDLMPGAWYYTEVRKALDLGLLRGQGKKTFAPDQAMTRAMVVQVLYQSADKPAVKKPADFSDVSADSWYADAVAWAVEQDVVNGVSARQFSPDAPMTRQDLAVVLWRYAGAPEVQNDLSDFRDGAQTAQYARTAMTWMTQQGFLKGANGLLNPTKTVTRAEAATILLRYTTEV